MKTNITFLRLSMVAFALAFYTVSAQTPLYHYKFENSLVNDGSKGAAYNLNIEAAGAANYSTGQVVGSNAYQFPDATDTKNYLASTTSGSTGISGNAARTVAVWIKKPTGANFNAVTLGSSNSSGQRYTIRFTTDGYIKLDFGSPTIGGSADDGHTALPFDTWTHVVATMPANGTVGDNIIYVNGDVYLSGVSSTDVVNTLDFRVLVGVQTKAANTGVIGPATANPGEVDDLQIYDVALTEAQIETIMAGGTLGVADQNFAANELSVYPNAVTDYLNIESATANKFEVLVFDMLGKVVDRATVTQKLNMSSLASGLYIVKIRSGNKVASVKVAKK